jgi:hypothetical protein
MPTKQAHAQNGLGCHFIFLIIYQMTSLGCCGKNSCQDGCQSGKFEKSVVKVKKKHIFSWLFARKE